MRILAVDDDENIRDLLKTSITAESRHAVWTAASGFEALDMVEDAAQPFDCILLDIQMPKMDGIELCQRLRQNVGYERTPILMLTAMAEKKFVDRAFLAGATDYITKPFEFLEFFSRLNNAERLTKEHLRTDKRHEELQSLKRDLDRSFDHSLSEPVELLGVERLIGYVSYENYLLQLSRMKMMTTSVVAIKLLSVEKLFRSLSRATFRQMLSEVGELITLLYDAETEIVTYRGNGVFVIATPSRRRFSQFEMEKTLNRRIRDLQVPRASGITVQACCGEPVSLISFTRTGSLSSLQNAVTRAEMRSESYRDILKVSARLIRASGVDGPDTDKERAVYQNLLQEAMKEEAKLTANQ